MKGILRLFQEEQLDIGMAVSSETNFPTRQTGVGVTLIGEAKFREVPSQCVRNGDHVLLVGTPRTGLLLGDPDILPVRIVRALSASRGIHELIPLGSAGASGEITQLASRGIEVDTSNDISADDLVSSAGPANAVLIICSPKYRLQIERTAASGTTHVPVRLIGTVRSTKEYRTRRLAPWRRAVKRARPL